MTPFGLKLKFCRLLPTETFEHVAFSINLKSQLNVGFRIVKSGETVFVDEICLGRDLNSSFRVDLILEK